jgi:integrase
MAQFDSYPADSRPAHSSKLVTANADAIGKSLADNPQSIPSRAPSGVSTHGCAAASSGRSTDTIPLAAAPTRKRGKCLSRRRGQNPRVRVGTRANGTRYYYFQFCEDIAGQEERHRRTEVLGLVGEITASEADRKKLEILQTFGVNSSDYRIPSARVFTDAVTFYREQFAPAMLRASTFDVADGHLRNHLEADWKDIPVEHITIKRVNEWAWKKRREGLSWVMIKNILRTMQRVLSCFLEKSPTFSLKDLRIPEKDKLQMKIDSRRAVSFSWADACRIADAVYKLDGLDEGRKARYAMAFTVASASGLRFSELAALRMDDVEFRAGTIRVDESACQRTYTIGQCKNARAYRTVLLADHEGREALQGLQAFVGNRFQNPNELVFHSKRGSPMRETNILHEALHPALKALGLPKAGMHAFRRGCNRRWELAGIEPAVLRQQMGHASAGMTARYTGEIPLAQVQAAFSARFGPKIVVSENKKNEAIA